MGQAGLKVEFDAQEQTTYLNNWFTSKLPGVYIFAFAPSVIDGNLPYHMLLKTGGQGYTFDERIDALMDQQIAETDGDKRAELLGQIGEIVYERTIYAPLFNDDYIYGVAKDVEWTPRPDGMMTFR